MENDTNRFGYNQWFYFSLVGAKPGITYCFKVVNFVSICLLSVNNGLSISSDCVQSSFRKHSIKKQAMDGLDLQKM